MVKLYGITHDVEVSSLFGSHRTALLPTYELLLELSRFKKGSRIGIEWFPEGVFEEIKSKFLIQSIKRISRGGQYYNTKGEYWQNIVRVAESFGHEIVFLENKEIWQRYNEAVIRKVVANRKSVDPEEGENGLRYKRRMLEAREKGFRREILAEKIHFLDRDACFLKTIGQAKLDAVIVGLGHSNLWWSQREQIADISGILFDSYGAEIPGHDPLYPTSHFDSNPQIDSELLWEKTRIERYLRLMKSQTLTGEAPQYVGTWDVWTPSQGYFEVFIDEKQGRKISGRIEDLLGTATFSGDMNKDEISFSKQYLRGAKERVRGEIVYSGIKGETIPIDDAKNVFVGLYDGRGNFYMEEAERKAPIQMGVNAFFIAGDW